MKKLHLLIFLLAIFVSCNNETNDVSEKETKSEATQTATKLHWHWEDYFSSDEKEKIKKYITSVTGATFNILGNYPFEVHYYFKRSDNENEPIPWAHTIRNKKIQGVRFYINPLFNYEVLHADWTAPHEISHLSIPFLGSENSWFSEGYASYMQYQIMQEMGVYTKEEVVNRYRKKITNIQPDYSDKMVFVENVKALRSRYNFPAMYWGSAMYFIHIDSVLINQHGTNLNSLIMEYQSGNRKKDKDIEMLLHSLEKDLSMPVFTRLYNECYTKSFNDIFINHSDDSAKMVTN